MMRNIIMIVFGKLFLTTSCLYSNLVYTQNRNAGESTSPSVYLSKIIPASPEAFKLGSYGNIPVGLFTGSSNINIPLINYSIGNISLPVSLHYSSSGVKVDDTNGSLGLTWNLIAGGVITRSIRGIADEMETTGLEAFPDIDLLGVLNPTVINYIKEGEAGRADTEPDLYTASFGDNSLKFVYDKTGQPIVFSQKNYTFSNSGLEITTEDGTKYTFTEPEEITSRTFGGDNSHPSTTINSIYLTKITDTKNNILFIEYEANNYKHVISRSQTMKYTAPGVVQYYHGNGGTFPFHINPPFIGEKTNHEQDITGKLVKRIFSNNSALGSIEFIYESGVDNKESKHLKKVTLKNQANIIKEYEFVYDLTSNNRRFLKEIIDNKNNSAHSFEYFNQNSVPSRLAYSRDIYGYYNAKNNPETLVPKIDAGYLSDINYPGADQSVNTNASYYGLIKKITYPTKGFSELFYEPNGYIFKGLKDNFSTGEITLNSKSDSLDIRGNIDTISLTVQKSEKIKIVIDVSFDEVCSTAFTTGDQNADFYVRDNNDVNIPLLKYSSTTNNYLPYQGNNVILGSQQIFYVDVINGKKIKFSLQSKKRCSLSFARIFPTIKTTSYVEEWVSFGGNRISKTIDDSNGSTPTIKEYKYENENGTPSYVEIRKPYFIDTNTNRYYQHNDQGFPTGNSSDVKYYTLTSSNLHQLNALHPNLFYSTVIESSPDKGSIVHKFSTETDWYGNQLLGSAIQSAPWSNYGWENGRELQTIFRDNSEITQKKIVYNYQQDNSKIRKVQGLSIRKRFNLEGGDVNAILTCNAGNYNSSYSFEYCGANHNHTWELITNRCIAAGHDNKTFTYTGPCHGKPSGTQIVLDSNLEI